VQRLAHADAGGFSVDGEAFDAVVLACTPGEAARLCRSIAPAWADIASGLAYEPIVTVYLHCEGARLPCAMTALRESADAPAQFAFDLGALGGPAGRFAFVVSGARRWVTIGLDATAAAVVRQATATFPPGTWPQRLTVLRSLAEKRATLRCTPGLVRPAAVIAPGLAAAGDYVAGPYPSTLEGAVRAGEAAIALVGDQPGPGSGTDWRREG
jgi:predicted NAD/FAD-binding protein